MSFNKINTNYFIILSGIIIFLIKWYQPFLLFKENIDVKVIFESVTDGYKYLPIFKLFTEFNLDYSYDSELLDSNNLSAPSGSFYIHSIFYFFLKSWAFIILELIFIIIFLGIFYKISRLLNFKRIESFLISIFLYNLPIFLDLTSLSNFSYISTISSDFYSLRFPRPLVTNIFFYYFVLLSLSILNKGELLKRKKFIILGLISGLSFTSFFYHLLLEQITLLICLIYIYKKNFFKYVIKNYISIICYIISFLIISLPLLLNINFAEKDFLERTGLLNLDLEKKKILLTYFFEKFFNLGFIILILISTFLYLFITNKQNEKLLSKNKIFFFLLFSSIVSPLIFILISPSYFSHFYFFNNLTVIIFFLLIFFIISKLLQRYLIQNISDNTFKFISITLVILILLTNFYGVNNERYSNQKNNETFKKRFEINEIVDILNKKNIDLKKSTLLTFDNKITVWFILNDIKNLKVVNGLFTAKKHEMIEDDLISSFKYLKLGKKDFQKFLDNKKKGWRYRNENVLDFFWHRYQANSLTTFKNSNDFDKPILDFIKESSPILSQQLIIPNFEMSRLLDKFDSYNQSFLDPNLVIINKKDPVLKKSFVNNQIFCKIFDGEIYVFYHKIDDKSKCD